MTATTTAPRNPDVSCACHDVFGDEVRACESCDVESCDVELFDCGDDRYLCDACTPGHYGCPDCDPDTARDRDLDR